MEVENGILYTPDMDIVFSQLPGLVLWENKKQEFLGLNKPHIDMLGFKSMDQAFNKTVFDIPCKAAELAEIFDAEEKEVLNSGKGKNFFGIIRFTSGFKAMMTAKKPLINSNGEIIGLFIQGFDITNINFLHAANILIQTDSHKHFNNKVSQFEYEILNKEYYGNLTQREIECLFFIIRGKSSKKSVNYYPFHIEL